MSKAIVLVAVTAMFALCSGLDLDQALTFIEQQQMANKLRVELSAGKLETVHAAVVGLNALKKDVPDPQSVCSSVDALVDETSICSLHKASDVYKGLGCKPRDSSLFSSVSKFITAEADVVTIAKSVICLAQSSQTVSKDQIASLINAFQRDDSPTSLGWALMASSVLPKDANIKVISDAVEDILQQADEIDGKMLQFEGGLEPTSRVISGMFELAELKKSAPALTSDQVMKFAMYFLSRKYAFSAKDISFVTKALSLLADNQYFVPVIVSQYESNVVNEQNPLLKVRVTNVFDKSVEDVSVTAGPVVNIGGETLFSNQVLKPGPKDDHIVLESDVAKGYIAANAYVLDIMSSSPARGVYSATMIVKHTKKQQKYISLDDAEIFFKVVSRVTVENVELSIVDREQSSSSKPMALTFPNKVKQQLEADYHQKIIMKFVLREGATGDLITAHQTFIRLTHVETGQEIFFVAEPESDNVYKFVLDLGTTGKDSFGNLSGKYSMDLIVGDSSIQIPIKWSMASVTLTFVTQPQKTKKQARVTGPQPVIEHVFRVPDKRPALVISNAFTVMVAAPIVLMLAMWVKIGANASNFNFSPSALVFHLGLAAIFALYYCFWTHLNMFQTLKYLALLGGVTFLFGNKMLANMASDRQNRS